MYFGICAASDTAFQVQLLSQGEGADARWAMLSELGCVEASSGVWRGKRHLIPSPGSTKQRFLYAATGVKLRRQTLLVDSS